MRLSSSYAPPVALRASRGRYALPDALRARLGPLRASQALRALSLSILAGVRGEGKSALLAHGQAGKWPRISKEVNVRA